MNYFSIKRQLLFVLLLVCFSLNALAEVYPVTQLKMDEVLSNSSPGDTIVLKDGTYPNIILRIRSSGEEGNPIVLKAETLGGVVFTGTLARLDAQADYWVIDGFKWSDIESNTAQVVIGFDGASHNVFRNNVIENAGRITEGSKTGVLRLSGSSRNNIIEYNRFDNLINLGIQVWAWDDDNSNTGNIIRYNYFVNHTKYELLQLGQGGASALVDQYTTVEYNLFEDITMADPELISCKTSCNTIRYNTFRNCRSMLVLRTGEHAHVEGNWFLNSHGIRVHDKNHVIINNYIEGVPSGDSSSDDEGIVLYSGNQVRPDIGDSHYPADSVLVANNTLINHMGEHILVGRNSASWPNAPKGVIVKNNLVVNDSETAFFNEASENSVWEQNMVFSSGSGSAGNVDNVLIVDPELSLEGEIYKLQPGSPAINEASPEILVTRDMEGQSRDDLDIGADEYSSDEITNRPLTAVEVGPGIGDGITKFTLETSVNGLGTISLDPSGNVFDSATVVSLTAIPAEGYKFDSWSGLTGDSPSLSIVMDGDKHITANFVSDIGLIPIDSVWATADDGNEPANTLDNDLSTRWSAEDGPQSIFFRLDSIYTIDYLMISWFSGNTRTSFFEIAVSLDGMVWDTIAVDTSSGTSIEQEMIEVPDANARYVQYIGYGNSSNDWNSITELDIHGSLYQETGIDDYPALSQGVIRVQNYPNPFDTYTTVGFRIQEPEKVLLQVFNLNGMLVDTLADGYFEKGYHEFLWRPSGKITNTAGIYFCSLITSSSRVTRKMSCINR